MTCKIKIQTEGFHIRFQRAFCSGL